MEIMRFIGNDCIDTLPVDQNLITIPGYIGDFIKQFKRKHQELILQAYSEPEFILHKTPGHY